MREALDVDEGIGDAAGALLAVLGADGDLLGDTIAAAVRDEAGAAQVPVPQDEWWTAIGRSLRDGMPAAAGRVDVAPAVIEELGGARMPPVADAVRAEAGEVDLTDAIVGSEHRLPLAAALAAEAGRVDVADAVLAQLDVELDLPVAEALRAEAGQADVAEAVLQRLGEESLPVAAAVHHEAGEVDVSKAVEILTSDAWHSVMLDNGLPQGARSLAARMLAASPRRGLEMTAFAGLGRRIREEIQREAGPAPHMWHGVAERIGVAAEAVDQVPGYDGQLVRDAVAELAGEVDVAPAVMQRIRRQSVAPAPEVPKQGANWGSWAGMAAAAVAAVVLMVSWQDTAPTPEVQPQATMMFASADEISVQALEYADDTEVQIIHSDDGPLIIWFDETDDGAAL